ncbi:MAG: hypothetical protein Q8P18_32805 [Pseudomonadota bacterium]|nr:hypothetical protein [Pseudomonadota bacterium]
MRPKPARDKVALANPRSPAGNEEEVDARLKAAGAHLQAGSFSEATRSYVWLWANIPRLAPSFVGVRRSFMAREIETLVSRSANARRQFARLRDVAAGSEGVNASLEMRTDWVVLNQALGEPQRTLAWFDTVKNSPEHALMLDRMAFMLVPLLVAQDRWAEIGNIHLNPMQRLRQAYLVVTSMKERQRSADLIELSYANFRGHASVLWRGLAAAGREADADAVKVEALHLDGSARMRAALSP